MGEKKIFALVMAYGLAVTTFTACDQHNITKTCYGYEALLSFCGTYFAVVKSNPSTYCCRAATIAFPKANHNRESTRYLCNCLHVVGPQLDFLKSKLVSLPGACGISPSFSMQSCIYI